MKENKFRAWNGKEMFNVDVMAISQCSWDCPDYGKRGVSLAYQPNIQVMQYTGLKDKNGKEIYEGDVLEITMGAGSPLRCSIEYKAPSFCRRWIDKVSRNRRPRIVEPMAWNTNIIYEVIGNIYENPTLLEELQNGTK